MSPSTFENLQNRRTFVPDTFRRRPFRVAVVDDHQIIAYGVKEALEPLFPAVRVDWFRTLADLDFSPDVVLLDLRLDDGSTPARNLRRLQRRKIPVVVYTSADDPVLVREAIAHDALAVIRKSAPPRELVAAIEATAKGEVTPGLDWAAALDADEDFVVTNLSPMETKVLSLYASGALSETVARTLGIAASSVNTYVNRIRVKYREAGRNVDSRVDLFLRAAEDGLVSYFGPDDDETASRP